MITSSYSASRVAINDYQNIPRHQVSSVAKVFAIPELQEQVLIRLDMKTLLLAQRVSKQWQINIQSTTSLQKKLFLTPATHSELSILNVVQTYDTTMADGSGIPVDRVAIKVSSTWEMGLLDENHKWNVVVALNPLLLQQLKSSNQSIQWRASEVPKARLWHMRVRPQTASQSWLEEMSINNSNVPRPFLWHTQSSSKIPHQSWMDMFLTQPPVDPLSCVANKLENRTSTPFNLHGQERLGGIIVALEADLSDGPNQRTRLVARGLLDSNADLVLYGHRWDEDELKEA